MLFQPRIGSARRNEVDGIMNLLRDYLKDAENFKDENIKMRFLGDRTPLADDIKGAYA